VDGQKRHRLDEDPVFVSCQGTWWLLLLGALLVSTVRPSLQEGDPKQVVQQAPAAELENDIDDIDVTGGRWFH